MFNRTFNAVIVLFWLATTTWLITAKVLPPLLTGEPPTYRAIVADQSRGQLDPPTRWDLYSEGARIGWARSHTDLLSDELMALRTELRFDDLPIDELSPLPLGAFSGLLKDEQGHMTLDATNSITVDSLGKLDNFQSSVRFGVFPAPIRMQGRVEGNRLMLTVRLGEMSYPTEMYFPSDSLLGDVLSPQTKLPNLRVGQHWTLPVYSPFGSPNTPMQVLVARVEREQTIVWNGRGVLTRVVVYRPDQGSGLDDRQLPQGTAWVAIDGTVLRQEARIGKATLRFERVAEPAAATLD